MNLPTIKIRPIVNLFLLSFLILGGITSCSSPNTSTDSQGKSSPTTPDLANSSQSSPSPTNTSQPTPINPQPPNPNPPEAKAYQTTEQTRRRNTVLKQVEAVLTQVQLKQLETKLQQGEKMRQSLSELSLTPEQNTKVQEIFKAGRTQHEGHTKRDKTDRNKTDRDKTDREGPQQ